MIHFFQTQDRKIIAAEADAAPNPGTRKKLEWLFGHADFLPDSEIKGYFVGPRKEMITPWSTNAVEIAGNMGIAGIVRRIEEFFAVTGKEAGFDPMLQALYDGLDQHLFSIDREPEPVLEITDIAAYNAREGLALNPDEIAYLEQVSAAGLAGR
jgi:phosphoribosylformylglycinamidine synthase